MRSDLQTWHTSSCVNSQANIIVLQGNEQNTWHLCETRSPQFIVNGLCFSCSNFLQLSTGQTSQHTHLIQDRVIYLLKHARNNGRCAAASFRHKVSIRAFNWPSCCTRECRINVAVTQYIRNAPRGLVILTSYSNSSWRLKWLSRTKSNTSGIQASNYKLVNEAKRSTCRTRGHHEHKQGQILPAHTITGHT